MDILDDINYQQKFLKENYSFKLKGRSKTWKMVPY